jgi:tetratricopeptide (TPR) repeat protein
MNLLKNLLTFLCLLTITGCDFKSAQDYLIEAEKLENEGKYIDAIPLLDKAIEKDPNLLGAYINRAADKSDLGDYNSAIIDYQKVLKIDTNNTLAYYNLGNNFKRLENYELAIEYYFKAFETKGASGMIYIDYSKNEFIDKSEFDVPGHEIAYERGLAYYEIDSFGLAINDMKLPIKNKYMLKESHFRIGVSYFKLGEMVKACRELKIAAKMGEKRAIGMSEKLCH